MTQRASLASITVAFLLLATASATGASQLGDSNRAAWVEYREESIHSFPTEYALPSLEPTVSIVGTEPGQFGGRRFLLKRTDRTWQSAHRVTGAAVQGDPRWFVRVIGRDAARFFGFELRGSDVLVGPDAKEFNGAIDAVNEVLRARKHEPIAIRFYEVHRGGVSQTDYLRRFPELPLDTADGFLPHDWAFHAPSILSSNSPTRLAAYHRDLILAWTQALQSELGSRPGARAWSEDMVRFLIDRQVRRIDVGTGHFVVDVERGRYFGNGRQAEFRLENDAYQTLTSGWINATDMLDAEVDYSIRHTLKMLSDRTGTMHTESTGKGLEIKRDVDQLLRKFLAVRKDRPEALANDGLRLPHDTEQWIDSFLVKRQRVREAVAMLQRSCPQVGRVLKETPRR